MSTINKADYVLSVSNGAAEVVKSYGFKGQNLYVIRNGTDMAVQDVSKESIEAVKKELKINDEMVFLFVGRLVSLKNVQFSLQALAKLKERGITNFKFLIVGSGDYEKNLRTLTEELNLTKEVVFVGKVLDRAKLSAIYAASNLFLFPSTFDTCGIVVIEAAANKTACVVLKDSCPAEMIADSVNGFILPLDADVWADKLKELTLNKEKLADVGKKAAKEVYISWEDVSKHYFEFYEKVLKGEVKKSFVKIKIKKKARRANKAVKQRLKNLKKQQKNKKIKP